MAEQLEVQMARFEEKLDSIKEKVDLIHRNNEGSETRLRTAETKINTHATYFGIIAWAGTAVWAVILILVGKIFGKWFGG